MKKTKQTKKALKRKIKPKMRAYIDIACPFCYNVSLSFSMHSIFEKNSVVYYCEKCERVFSLSLKEEKPNPEWLEQLRKGDSK